MEKFIPILSSLWVHEHAAKIYLTLLDRGEKSIVELTKLSGLYRVEIYRQLPFLLETGLVMETLHGKRKKYRATSPYKVREIYENQQENVAENIEHFIEHFSLKEKKPHILYQEGKKAIMYVFSDIIHSLKQWDVFYRISSEKNVLKANTYLPKDYRALRDSKQLERYVIMSERGAKTKIPRLERELVTIPPELDEFDDNISLTLYGNKIAYIDFNTETSIIIEHPALADFHKKMFRIMYMSLRK